MYHSKGGNRISSGLVWQDRFNIGVEIIDKSHMQLFSTMNRLLNLSERKVKSKWVCQEGVKYLKVHAMKHFAEEEAYMRSIDYSGYEMHRRVHKNFLHKTLPALERELEETNYSVDAVRHFLGVCIGWTTAHTLTEDHAITGAVASKWDRMLPEEDIDHLTETIIWLLNEMFVLDARIVNEHYRGEDFGNAVYHRIVYKNKKGERRETVFILEDGLLISTAGAMMNSRFNKVDDVVLNAARYISRQFLRRVGECFPAMERYVMVEESLLTREQFQEIFEKVHPQCSLLFGTDAGYVAFCSYVAVSESKGIGRIINTQNAMDEIRKYLNISDKRKIFVVDDSNAVRQGLKKMLEKDYKVTVADGGQSAVKRIAMEKPDLILLDYMMPGCDGLQTLKMIRNEKELADIPVIFLTGKVDQGSITKIMEAKPSGYLLKTMRSVDIKKNIDAFFGK